MRVRERGGLGESVSNVCPTSFDEIDPTQAFCSRIPQLVGGESVTKQVGQIISFGVLTNSFKVLTNWPIGKLS